MALKLKYTDEHGILHINMSPSSSPHCTSPPLNSQSTETKTEISDPKFDSINNRFSSYDLFGGKYEFDSGETLFRSRYNSIEEELANTPYAFATERSLRYHSPLLDITIKHESPNDIEDDRFFHNTDLFGPHIDSKSDEDTPAFTVTQLIHAQDRYFDLSSRSFDRPDSKKDSKFDLSRTEDKKVDKFDLSRSVDNNAPLFASGVKKVETKKFNKPSVKTQVKSASFKPSLIKSEPSSARNRSSSSSVSSRDRPSGVLKGPKGEDERDEAFRVLSRAPVRASEPVAIPSPVVPTSKRKREKSFAILAETVSRPSSPRSLPLDFGRDQRDRVSPFRGRGFREETSRHTTPKTSATNSRATSPRLRTSSLSRIDKMATAALPPPLPIHNLSRPHSPRNFVKENIEEIRELSELNREKHEAEAELKRLEDEEALLKEMGLLDKNSKSDAIRSVVCSRNASRANSRSNSPGKKLRSRSSSPKALPKLRSRSNSPAAKVLPSAILHFENISSDEFADDAPVTHKSRVRSISRSQPQSNDGSPKHSKIPKRQSSVSPSGKRDVSNPRKVENNLGKNQRFISNSTSSIHETIRIGGASHDKRNMSKSTALLSISPKHIKGKPPISPNRGGPPPSNKAINPKRLSPIVGTPNKSPIEDKPKSARTSPKLSPLAQKSVKTAGNTPATSKFNSRQPSRTVSRDVSPEKRKATVTAKPTTAKTVSKPVTRAVSTKTAQKPTVPKVEPKKPINRTSSMKSLTRTPSTKTLNEKPPLLRKRDSKKDLKAQSTTKINEVGNNKDSAKNERKSPVKTAPSKAPSSAKPIASAKAKKEQANEESKKTESTASGSDEVSKQDNETQYDKVTNEKGDLVILTKKNIVSMTTAAITSQPLEVVTKVTNQLPATLEKAREKGIFERHSSKDSLAPKDENNKVEDKKEDDKIKSQDNIKLKPLLPPYNNPQVERVKQKIDDILKTPEVSTEHIINTPTPPPKLKSFKNIADKAKNDIKESKDETTNKFMDLKHQMEKKQDETVQEIRSEATKIVDSIITPVEEPKEPEKPVNIPVKKEIEPIVMVVNEKTNGPNQAEVVEKMTETLVKGEPEVEVLSSNVSSPGDKMAAQNKMAESNGSDKSNQSNGGFPQSTSTTPKPPARTKRDKDDSPSKESTPVKPPTFGQKILGSCKKCCACVGGEEEEKKEEKEGKKRGLMSKLNCCKRGSKMERDVEAAAEKAASIEFESETKRKRKFRDIMCACCGRHRRVSDVSSDVIPRRVDDVTAPAVVGDTGCCGAKRGEERRDSILSDRPSNSCCNNRMFTWLRGACRRNHASEDLSASRRQSMFSKNKSLSPTLPPEDTRTKLDPSLVEHTSVMRGAIPVLPIVLAWICLFCNVLVPGLGTIFSGMFCLCFGIPRFGVYDGAKHRIGSFLINILVGCGQLFTVLFCLVGWGWSIWWGVIMVKISRKYRKLKAEEALEEAEAPPVTANNHARA